MKENEFPLFSICLPSRDRFETVIKSIESVTSQDFPSCELLISDNSTTQKGLISKWHSKTGETSCVVRVFETERDLNMDENWEFISTKATGKYVLFLADRWVMRPGTLEVLSRIVTQEDPDLFFWPGQKAEDLETTLTNAAKGAPLECKVVSASEVLSDFLQFTGYSNQLVYGQAIPRAMNSGYKRELGLRAIEIWPHLFRPISPDYTSAIALLLLARKCIRISEMMYLPAGNKSNFSDSSIIGLRSYLKKFPGCNNWRGLELDIVFLTVLTDIEHTLSFWSDGDYWRAKMNVENALKSMLWEIRFKEFNGSLLDTEGMRRAIFKFGVDIGLSQEAIDRVISYNLGSRHRFVYIRKILRRLDLYERVRHLNNAIRYRQRGLLRSNAVNMPVARGRRVVIE